MTRTTAGDVEQLQNHRVTKRRHHTNLPLPLRPLRPCATIRNLRDVHHTPTP
jgi:hypothetical protein